MILRPYQQSCEDKTFQSWEENRSVVGRLFTGGGKTIIFSSIIRRFGKRALVIAHREELIWQARNKIEAVTGFKFQVEMGDYRVNGNFEPDLFNPKNIGDAGVVATIQTLSSGGDGCGRMSKFLPTDFDLMIVDECFLAGTLVDGKPIEQIRIGSFVNSWNHSAQRIEKREVLNVFKSKSKSLVKVKFKSGREIICTPSHPFWCESEGDYIPAMLLDNSCIVRLDFTQHEKTNIKLRNMRGGNPNNLEQAGQALQKPQMQERAFIQNNGENKQDLRIGKNDQPKSNAVQRSEGQGKHYSPSYWASACYSWWKRTRGNGAAKAVGGSPVLDNRTCHTNQNAKWKWLSNLLQGGCWKSGNEDSGRCGWEFTFTSVEARARQEKGCAAYFDGVESVEIFKRGSDDEFVGMCDNGEVFNLHIEGNNNYFANGVLVHNCHHATAPIYRKAIDYFLKNPNLKILGVTATPSRSDEESIGQIFEDVAFDHDMQYGMREGWLAPVDAQAVHVESLDTKSIKITAGDLNQGQLASVMMAEKPLHGMAYSILEIAGDKRGIGFSPSVEHARMMTDIFNRHRPGWAAHINGKTDKDERKKINSDFANGTIRWIWNCGTHCLDENTEILTRSGWVGINEMSYQHKVANWDNGEIFFKEPKFIIKRDRYKDEKIVTLETKNKSIRVTEKHRMLFKKYGYQDFGIIHAGKLVGERGFLPVSGTAKPEPFKMPEVPFKKGSLKRKIQANSFYLRKRLMLSLEDSKTLAEKLIKERDLLSYTTPPELTLDDCKLIGYWIGDGCKTRLKTGGVEYTLAQACGDKKICAEVDRLIKSCGFDYKIITQYGNAVTWALCRGTGFGCQKRKGVFRIEPYLQKDGTDLFWSLNENQFDSLIVGLWMADGEHYDNPAPLIGNLRIASTNKKMVDLFQAIACCRGYRASVTFQERKKKNHSTLYRISITKKEAHEMTKFRLQFESGWKNERIWCVTSDTGNIITRRRGTITVTGNTEGFDDAGVEVIVPKPTKSVSLLEQMVGRGTRPANNIAHKLGDIKIAALRRNMIAKSEKSSCLVLEYYGNRYDLATTFDLFAGNVIEDAIKEAKEFARKSGGRTRVMKSIEEEEKKAEEKKKRELEEAARKAKLVVKSTFKTKSFDLFSILGITAAKPRGWDVKKQPSENMQKVLRRAGYNPEDYNYAEAKQLVGVLIDRWKNDRCTLKQAATLKKYGYDVNSSFEDAKKIITAIQANGWRKPAGLTPVIGHSRPGIPKRKVDNGATIDSENPF